MDDDAMTALLPPEVWSEVLPFLRWHDLVGIRCVSRTLSLSVSIAEKTSHLAMRAVVMESSPEYQQPAPVAASMSMPASVWNRCQSGENESWLGLHRIFSLLAKEEEKMQAQDPTPGFPNGEENTAEGENSELKSILRRDSTPTSGVSTTQVSIWMLFGNLPLPPGRNHVVKRLVKLLLKFVRRDYFQISSRSRRWCSMISRSRIIQAAVRLGDAGFFDLAAELLAIMCETHQSEAKEEKLSLKKDSVRSLLETRPFDFATVDANICASNILVDKVYAKTFVCNCDDNDARDLVSAVRLGRAAITQIQAHPHRRINTKPHNHSNPLTTTSLFANQRLRLANARLASARALSLLAQHIGIGIMDPSHHDGIVYAEDVSNVAEEKKLKFTDINALKAFVSTSWFSSGRVANLLLQEALGVIESSLKELDSTSSGGGSMAESQDLFEIYAATLAARGELLYCAASANSKSFVPLLSRDTNRSLVVEQLARDSIRDLRRSFELIANRLASLENLSLGVESWCTHAPTKSLVWLLCQVGKDLAKGCDFADSLGIGETVLFENSTPASIAGIQYLDFARAVSLRLRGPLHPLTVNIERLSETEDIDHWTEENCIDQWLQESFSN